MQKFQNNIQDQFGNEITLPTITVRNVIGGGLSTLFSDDGVTSLANPFIAQDLSEFFFYAPNNRYDIFITGPVTDSSLDVLLFDPADGGVDASTARTGNFLFDADVSGSDPEGDSIKFNSVTPASITSCRIALTDLSGLLIADLTALSLVGSRMRVWDELDSTQLQEFVVSTVPALDVDHFEFTVDFIAGTASMPADDKRLRVQFELTSFLGAGISSGDQNSMLFWDTARQWSGTDTVQLNPAANPVGGHLRAAGSGATNVNRAMIYHNVGNDTGATIYAETELDQGFYLYADFNGSPRRWEFGYDDGSFNDILRFEDSPLTLGILGPVRFQQGEKSAAGADEAGQGQWWVRDDAPNTPMFTDDAGNDFELNAIGGSGVFRGAKAYRTTTFVLPNNATPLFTDSQSPDEVAVALNAEVFDTDSIHDNSTNNSRMTVPSGVTKVRISGGYNMQATGGGTTGFRHARIRKDGGIGGVDPNQGNWIPHELQSPGGSGAKNGLHIDTGVITVSPGDYFELYVLSQNAGSITVTANSAWMEMEIFD